MCTFYTYSNDYVVIIRIIKCVTITLRNWKLKFNNDLKSNYSSSSKYIIDYNYVANTMVSFVWLLFVSVDYYDDT